jgi:hypothetical protein
MLRMATRRLFVFRLPKWSVGDSLMRWQLRSCLQQQPFGDELLSLHMPSERQLEKQFGSTGKLCSV